MSIFQQQKSAMYFLFHLSFQIIALLMPDFLLVLCAFAPAHHLIWSPILGLAHRKVPIVTSQSKILNVESISIFSGVAFLPALRSLFILSILVGCFCLWGRSRGAGAREAYFPIVGEAGGIPPLVHLLTVVRGDSDPKINISKHFH